MTTPTDDLRDSGGWYACSQAYLHLKFGVDVWEHPYGIGDCEVPLEDACLCYLDGDFLHPIARGELVWAITGALTELFEEDMPTNNQLDLAKRVVLDAQLWPWAIGAILPADGSHERIDRGSFRLYQWLKSLDGLDFGEMRRRYDEYFRSEPHAEINAHSVIVGPYNIQPWQQDYFDG